MPYLYLSLVVAFIAAAMLCVAVERKSRKWYLDRALIQLAGFFWAFALVAFAFFVHAAL